jgi:hypothetical protein
MGALAESLRATGRLAPLGGLHVDSVADTDVLAPGTSWPYSSPQRWVMGIPANGNPSLVESSLWGKKPLDAASLLAGKSSSIWASSVRPLH